MVALVVRGSDKTLRDGAKRLLRVRTDIFLYPHSHLTVHLVTPCREFDIRINVMLVSEGNMELAAGETESADLRVSLTAA